MRTLASLPALVAALSLAAAPAVAGPTVQSAERPLGLKPSPSSVEAGLWDEADKAERQAKARADLNHDPALNAYVRDVLCKVARDYCPELRLYVVDRPVANAFMSPNGYSEVWSGLLLRATTESELALVLAHETAHYTHNHSIERFQAVKRGETTKLVVGVALAVAGAAAAANSGSYQAAQDIMDLTRSAIDVLYLSTIAAYFSYNRAQESEADVAGFERLVAAGYAPEHAGDFFRASIAETAASSFKSVRASDTRLTIFRSHPIDAERVAVLEKLGKQVASPTAPAPDRHRAAIRPHLAAWLKDDLRRRDFGQTLHLIDRLAASGEDLGVLEFYRGEAHRLRRGDGDLDKAEAAYERAVVHADAPLAAWRELGDLRRKGKKLQTARTAYETYLEKAADAEDAWLVRDSLKSLDGGSQ